MAPARQPVASATPSECQAPPPVGRAALARLVGPSPAARREDFFASLNDLFARKAPVEELPRSWARDPDPAIRQAFRIASQELGRSRMPEMERQDRLNGTCQALGFAMARDPKDVKQAELRELLNRLEGPTDDSVRYLLRQMGSLTANHEPTWHEGRVGLARQLEGHLQGWIDDGRVRLSGARGPVDLVEAASRQRLRVRDGAIDLRPVPAYPRAEDWLNRLSKDPETAVAELKQHVAGLSARQVGELGAQMVERMAEFPYGRIESVASLAVESARTPGLRPLFEANRERWLGLSRQWEDRGMDDRIAGYTGVYGLELYAGLAQGFPGWKTEELYASLRPLLAQNSFDDGRGVEFVRSEIAAHPERRDWFLEALNDRPQAPGRERFRLLTEALESGWQPSAAQKEWLLGWFHPMHQGGLSLPWAWNERLDDSLACLEAALPTLDGATLPDGKGGRQPVTSALREHFLQGPEGDQVVALGGPWLGSLTRLIAPPGSQEKLLEEVRSSARASLAEQPDQPAAAFLAHLLGSPTGEPRAQWMEIPQRVRNGLALLTLAQSPELPRLLQPLAGTHQRGGEAFVAPHRAGWVAERLAQGSPDDLASVARLMLDRRLSRALPSLESHLAELEPARVDEISGWLRERLDAPSDEVMALTSLMVKSRPELEEAYQRALLGGPEARRWLTSESRAWLHERLRSAGGDERQRLKVVRLLLPEEQGLAGFPGLSPSGPPTCLTAWAAGAAGWVGEVTSQYGHAALDSVEMLMEEADPEPAARAILSGLRQTSLFEAGAPDPERLEQVAQAFRAERERGASVAEALERVVPKAEPPRGGGLAEDGQRIIVGGTQVRRREPR